MSGLSQVGKPSGEQEVEKDAEGKRIPKARRIFAISDIHVDFPANMEWVREVDQEKYKDDVLVLAGDVCDNMDKIRESLTILVARFHSVHYVVGNHELWARKEEGDSVAKWKAIMKLGKEIGVKMEPAKVSCPVSGNSRWFVPMQGWYRRDFVDEPTTDADSEEAIEMGWSDAHFCKWPASATSGKHPSRYFSDMNLSLTGPLGTFDAPVVTFSHFLPRRELMPPTMWLWVKFLPRVAGDKLLDIQLRTFGSKVHIFGHTHIPWDSTIDGVRYVQQPLKYPRERKGSKPSMDTFFLEQL